MSVYGQLTHNRQGPNFTSSISHSSDEIPCLGKSSHGRADRYFSIFTDGTNSFSLPV